MKQVASVLQLDAALDSTPIVYEGEPLLLAELGDLVVERDVGHYIRRADDLAAMPIERTILLGPNSGYFDRWPSVRVNARAPSDLARFNNNLFRDYERVARYAFTQSSIATRIEEDLDVDVIALLLFDGLSYMDWLQFPNVEACLVEGPTITEVGFQNIVGKPTVARRLFQRGIRRRIGFSYWGRDNALTNKLFHGFDPTTQLVKTTEFSEVLRGLDKLLHGQTYVQIVVNGLDSICHKHRGRPPVDAIARSLYENVLMALAERLKALKVTALIYAAADHGILWKPSPDEGGDLVTLENRRTGSHRCAQGSLLVPHSKQFDLIGHTYTVLAYPYLFNPMRVTEWGTHGGISFQESVVPFTKLEVT